MTSSKEFFQTVLVFCFISLGVTGCVSTHMKAFVGKDIREVMMVEGAPINAFDLAEGKRAFQYRFGGGTFISPQASSTTANATVIGNTMWLDRKTITQPALAVQSEGCVISYIADYDNAKSSWIITDIRYPKRLVC